MLAAAASFALMMAALTACASGGAQVPVRATLEEYSWAELSAISDEIAAAQDDASAASVAGRYNLAADVGQSKEVELADGSFGQVVVIGFNHDELAGGGKAGITFAFAAPVGDRAMNNGAGYTHLSDSDDVGTIGGWAATDMRAWLNGDFAASLPADLRSHLADVLKKSVVVPECETVTDDEGVLLSPVDSLVGETVDRLWIPAVAEVANVRDEDYPEWTAPLKAEGSRYAAFPREQGRRWWLRTVEDFSFAQVLEDGSVDHRDQTPSPGVEQAVVACFALA